MCSWLSWLQTPNGPPLLNTLHSPHPESEFGQNKPQHLAHTPRRFISGAKKATDNAPKFENLKKMSRFTLTSHLEFPKHSFWDTAHSWCSGRPFDAKTFLSFPFKQIGTNRVRDSRLSNYPTSKFACNTALASRFCATMFATSRP